MGRPPEFTQEIADIICERIAEGESLRSICRDDDMPSCGTVCKWLSKRPIFVEQYARARDAQADVIFDEILDISDNPVIGITTKTNSDGGVETTEGDMIAHRRLQIDARKWMAGKLRPKKYGDKTTIESTGPDGGPIQSVGITTSDPVEAAKVYQRLIGER